MTKRNVPQAKPPAEDLEFERSIFEACRATGKLFAQTEAEVAREEHRQRTLTCDLPQRLRDADAVWERVHSARALTHLAPLINAEIGNNLARAARQGKPISREVLDQMHQDRQRAEREGKD
jgi:hypothetical protein